MEFNLLHSQNFNQYPMISPINLQHEMSDPFLRIDDGLDDDLNEEENLQSEHNAQNKENNNNDQPEILEDNIERENPEEALIISPKISEYIRTNLFQEDKNTDDDFFCEIDDKQNLKNTTDKTKIGKIELKTEKNIFGLKTGINQENEILPRIDYAIKNFKVTCVKFIKEYANKLIKNCKFMGELKNKKLFSPSNKYFTGVSNEKDNAIFLDFTVAEIFSYPNGKRKDNRLQESNRIILEKIKETVNNLKQIPESYRAVLDFLNMTFEDAVMLFYKDEEFLKYKETDKAKFLDSQFVKVKGFSLLSRNAFIHLMRHDTKSLSK